MKSHMYWLSGVIGRVCTFFVLMTFLTTMIFFLGSFQDFLDETQIMLLRTMQWSSMFAVLTSVFLFFSELVFGITLKKVKLGVLGIALIVLVFMALFLFLSSFILVWITPYP